MTASATRPRDDPVVLAGGVRRGERASVARMLTLVEAGDDAARPAIAASAVNKVDCAGADAAVKDLVVMLELAPAQSWTSPIVETVASTGAGVDRLWDAVIAHRRHLVETGALEPRRRERLQNEVREMVKAHLLRLADSWCRGPRFESVVKEHTHGAFDPQRVAELLVAAELGAVTT